MKAACATGIWSADEPGTTITSSCASSSACSPKPAFISACAIILPMSPHQTLLRVRYAETDQMGVVYYANYLVWMEVARVEYCKAAGFSYEEMEREDGIFLAVTEAHCRYLYPARFAQEVMIE